MDFTKMADLIDSLGGRGIPGCDCIVHYRYREVFRRMQGYSDTELRVPKSAEDMHWLYSATKPVTCAAVMQLIERGMLGLEDPVAEYLPAFSEMAVRDRGRLVPARTPITIRSLMSMSSGLNYDLQTPSIRETVRDSGGHAATRQIVDAIAREPLDFEPSTHYQYSLSHDVLAAVVEAVSGTSFSAFLQENIFGPLGMEHSAFHVTPEIRPRLAAAFLYDDRTHTSAPSPDPYGNAYVLTDRYESGGAGMISTAEDYIRFADAMGGGGTGANGARILEESSIARMRQNEFDGVRMRDFRENAGKPGYGYGLGVRTLIDPAAARSPVGEFGWDGAAGSYVMIDPVNHVSLFYAQQVLGCVYAYGTVHPALRDLTYECLGL